jgi:hypothetical protein
MCAAKTREIRQGKRPKRQEKLEREKGLKDKKN